MAFVRARLVGRAKHRFVTSAVVDRRLTAKGDNLVGDQTQMVQVTKIENLQVDPGGTELAKSAELGGNLDRRPPAQSPPRLVPADRIAASLLPISSGLRPQQHTTPTERMIADRSRPASSIATSSAA